MNQILYNSFLNLHFRIVIKTVTTYLKLNLILKIEFLSPHTNTFHIKKQINPFTQKLFQKKKYQNVFILSKLIKSNKRIALKQYCNLSNLRAQLILNRY